ncbi:MAG: hypothetical protein AAF517_28780, partial [Planctomycetota bacterium]
KRIEKTRTELLIVLTPHVITSIADSDRLTRETFEESTMKELAPNVPLVIPEAEPVDEEEDSAKKSDPTGPKTSDEAKPRS